MHRGSAVCVTSSNDGGIPANGTIVDANLDKCDVVKNSELKRKVGWIAQDVEAFFPKSVESAKDENGVDQIHAAAFGAVKKLIAKVEELERKLEKKKN